MGWSLTDAPTIFACRRAGAVAQLERVLGPADEQVDARLGRCSSRRSRCSAWKVVRCSPGCGRGGTIPPTRGRGCSTSATCCASAVVTRTSRRGRARRSTASRSGCSTTSTWGFRPAATCARAAGTTRSSRRAPSGCASRGWLDGDAFTDDGRNGREAIERATDRQMAPAIAALGDDLGDGPRHAASRGAPRCARPAVTSEAPSTSGRTRRLTAGQAQTRRPGGVRGDEGRRRRSRRSGPRTSTRGLEDRRVAAECARS